jgi:hypothetical protein
VTPTRFSDLLRVLTQHHVDYIVVGGIAAAAHGSVRATYDLDVVYARGGDRQADRREARRRTPEGSGVIAELEHRDAPVK